MKTTRLLLALALALALCATATRAATVTNYDSIVSLATNATKNYTFTDSASGQSVVIALTMTGYSPTIGTTPLQSLDSGTRVGGNFQNGFLDGGGVNFSASLVSASSGVAAGTIKFAIAGVGVRAADGAGTVNWISSASTNSVYLSGGAEIIQPFDTTTVSLGYTAQLRFPDNGLMQLSDVPAPGQSLVLTATFTVTNAADPHTNSWFTTYSGKYARIYTNDTMKTAGNTLTNWSNGSQTQSSPAYCGVQEVYSSSNWVYVRSTGLGSHTMGPWYLNTGRTTMFPNLPVNQKFLWRFPRNPSASATNAQTSLGTIGLFVDGVSMFDSSDGYVWTGSGESGNGTGYWHREAYANEGVTFDPGYAHQENTGNHHYHANPIALRYLLGDHVDYNATTKTYSESTNTATKHSPIVGWVRDGYPIYGPYAYSNALDASSPIIRMRSGFQLRNGSNGADNITTAGRANLPAWAQRLYGLNSSGPSVSTTYPIARYMEDYAYLADLTNSATGTNYRQDVEFDLDEHNGRWCVTPEFPGGTYAYFVSIETNGTPKYPNNIGRTYYGNPNGSSVSSISEQVVTNFLGGPNATPSINAPTVKNGAITLSWSATEGGTYMVQSTTNFSTWTTNSTTVSAVLNAASYTNNPTDNARFYRVARTALATYDSAGSGGYTQTINTVAPGGTATRGTTVTVTITLPTTPPWPPAGAPITSVTLAGSIAGTNISDAVQGQVIATFTIPANASTGAQSIVIVFNNGPTYTMTGSLTIN